MVALFGVMTTESGTCFAFPDCCKTPTPGGPVPMPYPNTAMNAQGGGAKKVKVRKKAVMRKGDTICMSSGDEPGCAGGGVKSNTIKGSAKVQTGYPKVKVEGKDIAHHTSVTAQNSNNANIPPGMQVAPSQMAVKVVGPPAPPGGGGGGKPPPPRQKTDDLDQLYADAAEAKKQLDECTQKVAKEVGATAKTIPADHPKMAGGLKERGSAMKKINGEYDGDAARVLDLARSTIVCSSFDQVEKAKAGMAACMKEVRTKDRFKTPTQEGYRDVLMNVEGTNGHICEVQIHLDKITAVKDGPGHKLYEQIREIRRTTKEAGRALTASERGKLGALTRESKKLYDAALRVAGG